MLPTPSDECGAYIGFYCVHRVHGDALPAAGIDPDEVDIEVTDGVVSLNGSVEGTERADALVQKVAEVPGVRDVAAMIRVSERQAA